MLLYAAHVSLMATKERLPFPVFLVVLVIVLMLAGFACACLSEHPEQALDRLSLAAVETPAPIVQAALAGIAALLVVPLLLARAPALARLQSFRL